MKAELPLPAWNGLRPGPLKMMPYLDSSYVFGNTCAEPNAWIREDMISTGAQKLKTALSRYGITYSAQFGFNYTGLTGGGLNGKTDFPPTMVPC